MFNKLRRMFGWKPIKERDYHDSFGGCIHHWNWLKNGQCPQCARGIVRSINWSLIREEDYERLKHLLYISDK